MLPMRSRDFDIINTRFWGPVLRQLDQLVDDQTVRQSVAAEVGPFTFAPSYEIDETDDHYVMAFDVPGVRREDLNIEVKGNRLAVSGERKAEGRNVTRRAGKFEHLFELPEGVTGDSIIAEHKDGVLRLALKKPAATRPMKITIADGTAQVRAGGFFKSLAADKKGKQSFKINGAVAKEEPEALAN